VEAAQRGSLEAYNRLLMRGHATVKQCARAYFLTGGEREDLVQEGLIGLCKAIRDYRSDREASFTHFADVCVRRAIVTAIRASTRERHAPLNRAISLHQPVASADGGPLTVGELLRWPGRDVTEQVELMDSLRSLARYLTSALSEREQAVLALHLEGRSYEQIAAQLGIERKAIDNAIQRLRRKAASHFFAAAA
jgi:RNA polymerase sporulation-specific sigma factor